MQHFDPLQRSDFALDVPDRGSARRTGEHGEKTFMTLWKNLVVALVAAFALAACSSSNDNGGSASDEMPPAATGPTQAELDAARAEAEREKDRADKLQEEKDSERAAESLAEARALFDVLDDPRAVAGNPEIGGETTTPSTAGSRPAQVTIPMLDESEMEAEQFSGANDNEDKFTVNFRTTREDPVKKLFSDVHSGERFNEGIFTFNIDDPAATDAIVSPDFPQNAGQRPYDEGTEFRGTYDGADGVYKCTAADCTATRTLNGIDLSAGWQFDPDDGATVAVQDSAYQTYGWWLQKNKDGMVLAAGPVYFTTPDSLAATGVTALQGTATYEGSAMGKYAIYSGAFSGSSEAGHFSADAMLVASFGSEDQQGRISGTINGFVTEAGDKDNWTVTLLASGGGLADGLTDAGAFSGDAVWKIGSVSSAEMGTYNGSLYESDKEDQDGVPYEAGGTFQAPFEAGVGQMVGAFAAKRTE